MHHLHPARHAKLAILPAISACSTSGFNVGAPSMHVPQSYETISSSAAVTSNLGGVVTRMTGTVGSTSGTVSIEPLTGSWNHSTGRLELNSGAFHFVDANGFAADGTLDNGAGVTGTRTDAGIAPPRAPIISGTYAYIIPFSTQETVGALILGHYGIMGVVTNQADMPSGGSATYTGDGAVSNPRNTSTSIPDAYLGGVSTVNVDFGAARVDVTINAFAQYLQNGVSVLPSAALMDELSGSDLVINGTNFSGGTWVALKNGIVVDLVGANPVTSSSGAFFGYDQTISAPDEVGGMITVNGATGLLFGQYLAD